MFTLTENISSLYMKNLYHTFTTLFWHTCVFYFCVSSSTPSRRTFFTVGVVRNFHSTPTHSFPTSCTTTWTSRVRLSCFARYRDLTLLRTTHFPTLCPSGTLPSLLRCSRSFPSPTSRRSLIPTSRPSGAVWERELEKVEFSEVLTCPITNYLRQNTLIKSSFLTKSHFSKYELYFKESDSFHWTESVSFTRQLRSLLYLYWCVCVVGCGNSEILDVKNFLLLFLVESKWNVWNFHYWF